MNLTHWPLVGLTIAALVAGYGLGRGRPLHKARDWAWWVVAIGKEPGRTKGATVICLLPERFVPLIWYRIRHGHYPPHSQRRPAPAPVLVNRRHDNGEAR